MVKITRVYTRKGDLGTTQLAAGVKIKKTSARANVMGDIDELNSFLGFAHVAIINEKKLIGLANKILRIQHELFNLGAQLAVPKNKRRVNTPQLSPTNIIQIEQEIDSMNQNLTSLNSFILPGGSEISARLHLARAICRRAERSLIVLKPNTLDGSEIPYLNRLSDWLFVAARFCNHILQQKEILWKS